MKDSEKDFKIPLGLKFSTVKLNEMSLLSTVNPW
jgi:hypothetical protein